MAISKNVTAFSAIHSH